MKILEEINSVEDFLDIITTRKIEGEDAEITYIEFKHDESLFEVQTDWTSSKGEPYTVVIGPEISSQIINLQEKIDIDLIKKSFVDNVKELAESWKDELILKKLSMEHVDEIGGRKALYAKIVNASNYVATYGRIGFATHMLISKENFEKYEIAKFEQLQRYKVIFDDSAQDIYLYKKNELDQPGLALLYNEEKFDFVRIGSTPGSQFIKVTLRK